MNIISFIGAKVYGFLKKKKKKEIKYIDRRIAPSALLLSSRH